MGRAHSNGGTLYLVSTPIGNLEDITFRAIRVLSEADIILAEDTRKTGRLLAHYNIASRMLSYYAHNESGRIPQVIEFLKQGQQIALVSDAGTPVISDPGYRLVRAVIDKGIPLVAVPGPSAMLAALVISGLPASRIVFEGFLPKKKGRQTKLQYLANEPGTIIIYESPHRIQKTIEDIVKLWGNRYIVISRELTKRHEEVLRGYATEILEILADRQLKGELVLLIAGTDFK